MGSMDLNTRLGKIQSGNFLITDLDEFVQRRAKEAADVVVLPLKTWVRLGDHWVQNLEVSGDLDDAYALLIVVPHHNNPIRNWLNLKWAESHEEGEWAIWWREIPNTKYLLDIFYAGDGENHVALAVESRETVPN